MKASIFPLMSLSLVFCAGCSPSNTHVTGEAFLVLQGGQSLKLGLIEVNVLRMDEMKRHVESASLASVSTRSTIERDLASTISGKEASPEWQQLHRGGHIPLAEDMQLRKQLRSYTSKEFDLRRRLDELDSGLTIFERLPDPIDSQRTDSNGAFQFDLPRNERFVLAAHGDREVNDRHERYFWIQPFETKNDSVSVRLSNDNLVNLRTALKALER